MSDTTTRELTKIERRPDLRIPVGSETVAATRYRPVGTDGPCPALLMYVPYHKDDIITYGAYDPFNEYLARHGYEVVVADMVGTGASTGHIDEMFVRREGREGAAIVEWLADREWTDGSVGMYGKSYGGITALDAAAQRPDALDAIVPVHTPYLGYRNGYTNNGLPELFTLVMSWLTSMQALNVKPPSRRTDDRDSVWQQRLDSVRSREPWLLQFLAHEYKDDYWADKDIPVGNIETPTLAVGGWRDSYTQDTVEYFEAVDAEKRLLFGPWRHTMPHRGREAAVDFRRQVVDWFDRFLKGDGGDTLPESEVVFWTERAGGGRVDGGTWRRRDSWPESAETGSDPPEVKLALTPDGLSRVSDHTSGKITREYEYDHTVGIEATNPYGGGLAPQDTSEDDARSLSFEGEPLSEPLELTGTGRARIRVRPTTGDFTLAVRVADVAPDDTARLVTEGTLRATCRDGLTSASPIEPGREYALTVPLKPKSHVFERDHRVRIAVAAAYFPETMPVGEQGSFTLLSSPSSPSMVRFPGRTRESGSFEDAVPMAPPDDRIPMIPPRVRHADTEWTTHRNRKRANVAMDDRLELDLPHANLTRTGTYEARVRADDPASLVAENEQTIELVYPDERVKVIAWNRVSSDRVELSTTVTLDGRSIFEETWNR